MLVGTGEGVEETKRRQHGGRRERQHVIPMQVGTGIFVGRVGRDDARPCYHPVSSIFK